MDSNLNVEQMRETSNQGPPSGSAINLATLTPSSVLSAQRQGQSSTAPARTHSHLSIPLPGPQLKCRAPYGRMGIRRGGVRNSLQVQTEYKPTDP